MYAESVTQRFHGKITSAEFGVRDGSRYLLGLNVSVSIPGVAHFGYHRVGDELCVNISDITADYQFDSRLDAYQRLFKSLNKLLLDAKVEFVSGLKGKPVEVIFKDGKVESFRILSEVL